MKICIILGTRPEIIKMSPIIEEMDRRGWDFFILHSNQHYSSDMDAIFFEELGIQLAKYNLNVGSDTQAKQIGKMLIRMDMVLSKEKPTIVLVQGDTNTVIAGALTANKLSIPLGHVEAGLRSYDRSMPEENNRIVADHLSDYLFAVSDFQNDILKGEGIASSKIYVVGNTIVDAVMKYKNVAKSKSKILSQFKINSGEYVLFTAHRVSNVDGIQELQEILKMLDLIEDVVCWPIHPRTKKFLKEYALKIPDNVVISDPIGYLDFLTLEQNAKGIITDSGGVQEEACILGVPCITIRDNTERPETIRVGANTLVGKDVEKVSELLNTFKKKWENPFGNGDTAKKILDIISREAS